MDTNDHTRVAVIYNLLDENEMVENYSEYSHEDLHVAFPELDDYNVSLLYIMLQAATNPDYNQPADDNKFALMVQEAAHQNFDGWSESDKVVINCFLADIALAVHKEEN